MQGNGHKNVNWTQEKNEWTHWELQQSDRKQKNKPNNTETKMKKI